MNIFVLSRRARRAAQLHCDKHVTKMLVETVQILSTVLRRYEQQAPYKSLNPKHPCVLWAAAHRPNFRWLCDLGLALADEHAARYPESRLHKCAPLVAEIATRDLSFLPAEPDAEIVAQIGGRMRVLHPPEDCLFAVVAGPSQKASTVSAYREIYARKRPNQVMRWRKSQSAPPELEFAFLEPETA